MKPQDTTQRLRRSFSRLCRFFTQLSREQLSCGPITVQQCYTLEALTAGAQSMSALAVQVGLHQSTMTRVVEKLEARNFVRRTRLPDNQRSVEVELTLAGRGLYENLEREGCNLVRAVVDQIPEDRRDAVVDAIEEVSLILSPKHEVFRALLNSCCSPGSAGETTTDMEAGDGPANM